MYTSYIGKKFLRLWNAREGKSFTARQFFDEVMFPVFFNDDRHLLHVSNSPFFQSLSAKDLSSGKPEAETRRDNLHTAVANKRPNASFFVGYAAEDATATTSGQVTIMPYQPDAEEIYASWIGEALAMGIGGGFYLLADKPELLLAAYEGWKYYRKFLQQTPRLKDRQMETWNGRWVIHWLKEADPLAFDPKMEERNDAKKGKVWAIPGVTWTELVFALCQRFPGEVLTVHAYNLSSTNTTLGFININLPEVHLMYEFRDKIFLDKTVLSYPQIEQLEPYFGFKMACQFGVVGLKAIQPDKLREYMPQVDARRNRELKITDDASKTQYNIYKIWISAMLNKTELLDLAAQIATILHQFEDKATQGRMTHKQLSDEVRSATTLRTFIDKLSEVLAAFPQAATTFRQAVDQTVKMPNDHFPLFVTLIRFEYNYQKTQVLNPTV